jgi:hypothetical protein
MVKRFVRSRTDRNPDEPENHLAMKSQTRKLLRLPWCASGVVGVVVGYGLSK